MAANLDHLAVGVGQHPAGMAEYVLAGWKAIAAGHRHDARGLAGHKHVAIWNFTTNECRPAVNGSGEGEFALR